MKTDIEIAQSCTLLPITAIGAKLGLTEEQLECYGRYKAKLLPSATVGKPQTGKLILVTAINPTAAGEGKTTTSIGLADSLSALGKKTVLALREPSLGPVFGLKGGATGGGWAQVAPMEDINLHFTGDFHAIGAANNLLAAMVDNHIYQGNALDIQQVTWRRCVDMNDRQLRYILCGLGGKGNGVPREEGFDITVATEVMAVLCLAEDLTDHMKGLGLRVRYMHSDIATIQRMELIRDLRLGEFDVLVGINLLREGLDLPEVSMVAILDADKEGFLRSETSLIQTIGRAARNAEGLVVLYADTVTPSMRAAITETERRRKKQDDYNKAHGIVPQTIRKSVRKVLEISHSAEEEKTTAHRKLTDAEREATIRRLEKEMKEASKMLEFEYAALLRDQIIELRGQK